MVRWPNYDPTDLVTLSRATSGISWDVPYDVALHWDDRYERMRALAFAKLWGQAHCCAVGDARVRLDPRWLATLGSDGRLYIKAYASWYGFSLSELPEEQREFAREVCESRIRDPWIRFFKFKPLTLASLEG